MYDPAHVHSRTVQPMGDNLKPDLALKTCLVYTTLAFLALLGAPYIYDISSLRVNGDNNVMNTTWLLCSKAVSSYHIGMRLLGSRFAGVLIEKLVDPWRCKPVPDFKLADQQYLSGSLSGIFGIHLMPELHLNTSATSTTIMNGRDHQTLNLFEFIFSKSMTQHVLVHLIHAVSLTNEREESVVNQHN